MLSLSARQSMPREDDVPVFFQNMKDLQDRQMLKRSIQEARAAKKGKFFYVPNSPAYGGPALIMSAPGGKMHPDLLRLLKQGGTPVKGTFRNLPDGGLVLMPSRPVNRQPFAEAVRTIALSVGISIPLQGIQILTPEDIKKKKGAAKPEDEGDEDEDDDSDSD